MRASLLTVLFLVTGAAAAQAPHRDRARQAETLGQMSRAAAEYEAAWSDDRTPEILYRLGIVRRRLREYRKAKDAFRGYLRALPDGPLRDEVERQIAQLNILIEAEAQDAPAAPPRGHADAGPSRAAGALPSAPVGPANLYAPTNKTMLKGAPERAAAQAARGVAPSPEQTAAAPATPAKMPDAASAEVRREAPTEVNAGPTEVHAAPVEVHAAPAAAPIPSRRAAPAAAIQAALPAAAHERSRAVPWLGAGAALAAAGGAVLWWDGDRVARDLDARFASGDLTVADKERYSRSRGEGIAGRALVAAALGLAGAAVLLW